MCSLYLFIGDYQTQISNLREDVEDLRLKNMTLEKSKEEVSKLSDVTWCGA